MTTVPEYCTFIPPVFVPIAPGTSSFEVQVTTTPAGSITSVPKVIITSAPNSIMVPYTPATPSPASLFIPASANVTTPEGAVPTLPTLPPNGNTTVTASSLVATTTHVSSKFSSLSSVKPSSSSPNTSVPAGPNAGAAKDTNFYGVLFAIFVALSSNMVLFL